MVTEETLDRIEEIMNEAQEKVSALGGVLKTACIKQILNTEGKEVTTVWNNNDVRHPEFVSLCVTQIQHALARADPSQRRSLWVEISLYVHENLDTVEVSVSKSVDNPEEK